MQQSCIYGEQLFLIQTAFHIFYFSGLINSIYQQSVVVSLVKMPPKRTIESFYGFNKAKLPTY